MHCAIFEKQVEDDQVNDENEFYFNLNIYRNLTEPDVDDIDNRSQFQQQNQNQGPKDSGWRFDKSNSRTIYF